MTIAIQSVFSGLTSGVEFSLIGIALVFCYRCARVVNLAEGETYMASAMLSSKMVAWGIPMAAAVPAGFALAMVGSTVLERFVLRPRLHGSVSRLVILTAGVAIFAEGLAYWLLGPTDYSVPAILGGPALHLEGAVIEPQAVLAIAVSVVLAVALWWFLSYTLVGHAMSALAERPTTAELVGINVGRLRIGAFAIAGFLGAVAALLIVPMEPITYAIGLTLTLGGYIAAAIGSMRSVGITWAAGMLIGLSESFFGSYVNALMAQPLVLGVLLIAVVAYLGRKVRFGGAARA